MCERHAESGFYYLKSRYYDPAICRFINADGLASTGQGFLGANMFAYCGNDPVNRKDDDGDLWGLIAIGAIIGGAIGGISAAISGGSPGDVAMAALEGAVTGGLCAVGGWGIVAGATVHGIYTGVTADGNTTTRVAKGVAAFGSTLFWGNLGKGIVEGLTGFDSMLANILLGFEFGVAAEATNKVIQSNIDVENDFVGRMFNKPGRIQDRSPSYVEYHQYEAFAL